MYLQNCPVIHNTKKSGSFVIRNRKKIRTKIKLKEQNDNCTFHQPVFAQNDHIPY